MQQKSLVDIKELQQWCLPDPWSSRCARCNRVGTKKWLHQSSSSTLRGEQKLNRQHKYKSRVNFQIITSPTTSFWSFFSFPFSSFFITESRMKKKGKSFIHCQHLFEELETAMEVSKAAKCCLLLNSQQQESQQRWHH